MTWTSALFWPEGGGQVGLHLGLHPGVVRVRLAPVAAFTLGHPRTGQEIAVGVGHRHAARREVGDTGPDQMDDGLDLGVGEGLARPHGHEHRRTRRGVVAEGEVLIGRQGDVDLGAGHVRDRVDGLFELALEGLEIVGLLGHVGAGDPLLVEEGETHRAGGGETGLGQREPLLVDVAGRNEDGGAPVGELVRHLVRCQLGRDVGGVGRLEVGEQGGVVGLAREGHEGEGAHHHGNGGGNGDGLLTGRELRSESLESFAGPGQLCAGYQGHLRTVMFMMSVKAATPLSTSATVTWVSSDAWVASIMASVTLP